MVVQHLCDLAFMATHGTSMPSPPKEITDDADPGRSHTTESKQRDQGPPDDHSDGDRHERGRRAPGQQLAESTIGGCCR